MPLLQSPQEPSWWSRNEKGGGEGGGGEGGRGKGEYGKWRILLEDLFGGLLPLFANVSIFGQCLFHWLMIARWINEKLCLLYVTTLGQIIRSNYTNTKAEWRLHVPFERQKCINYVSEPLCASFSSNLTWDWNLHKQRKFELVQTFVTKIILLKVILLLNMIMEQLTVKIKLTTHYRASTQWV